MLPRASFSVLLMVGALLAVTMLPAIQPASAGVDANAPSYRYAGVVETGRGIPTHYVRKGEGIIFYFFDSMSQGRKSQPYQLCVGPPGKAASRCWKQTAKYGVGKVNFAFTLPAGVPLGELTARWLVGGRTVASWAFFYDRPH
jgi:hypothetical protein